MHKDQALQYIVHALQLRSPQIRSLELLAEYLESSAGKILLGSMKKDKRRSISDIEASTREYFTSVPEAQSFVGFDERAYPTYTYALATGVGKTRLMGAFVAYLYLVYEVQHFMLVAPGNTIYKKLVDDFSKSANPKYVFRGLEELNTSTVKIITKDNYEQSQMTELGLYKNKIEINILNVQQFAQKDKEKEKGITKFSETLGESYFDYLASLDDLVVMLDESHHYHAEAAFQSLDRLAPLMGLEFTATPYTGKLEGRGKARTPVAKQSVVYWYNLGNAIRDGYVKDPWIGTEADVDFRQFDTDSLETDLRKLQLAVYFHERAKVAIKEYAFENQLTPVKPVMLVVAKDTAHADELKSKIDSEKFHGGMYRGKVLQIHTSLRGEESETAIEQLVSLEDPDNYIEIVIHVNMLKEGWDVANIYTIVPLRASAAQILTEQTIGRGLRLPYGTRTGIPLVDRVMVVAHGEYSRIIESARTSSLIQPANVEMITSGQVREIRNILEAKPVYLERVEEALRTNDVVQEEFRQKAFEDVEHSFTTETSEEVKETAVAIRTEEYISEMAKSMASSMSFSEFHGHSEERGFDPGALFSSLGARVKEEIQNTSREMKSAVELRNILIPRLSLMPQFSEIIFSDFDLDTSQLPRFSTEVNIIEEQLQAGEQKDLFDQSHEGRRELERSKTNTFGSVTGQKPENTLIAAIIELPLADYDEQKDLLNKLAFQAVGYYHSFASSEENLTFIIETHVKEIAGKVYEQMLEHKEMKGESFEVSEVYSPRSYLEQVNITRLENEEAVTLDSQLDTFSRAKIYTGFEKACHSHYKFDSSEEARLAYLLDREGVVEDWMHPAPTQFGGLYWRDETGEAQHRYEPDFVVEFEKEIVIAEVKRDDLVDDVNVQAKKITAEKYCEVVTQNIGKYGIMKPWRYVIVPARRITLTASIESLFS